MLKLEYLIFVDNSGIKCNNEKTFNHLLQSNPDIEIKNKKINYKDIIVNYDLSFGQIADTDSTYFHLVFNFDDIDKIEQYISLLKSIKSVIHIIAKSPQTLYDGISIYYSNLAYPVISDIENLMRKLITKFMLTKVGVDWIKDRTPDDVKTSINTNNKDLTYLHNVDFIQLKNFLFSENYPSHKENLIKKLKEAKDVNDLNIEDIKILIPNSNWERYFSTDISITKEKLIKNWDELYELRCNVAHNKSFTKSDYEKVAILCKEIRPILEGAINSLSGIEIDLSTREMLKDEILSNFNTLYGEFISGWRILENFIYQLSSKYLGDDNIEKGSLAINLRRLTAIGIIDIELHSLIKRLSVTRSLIVHNSRNLTEHEINESIIALHNVLNYLDTEIKKDNN